MRNLCVALWKGFEVYTNSSGSSATTSKSKYLDLLVQAKKKCYIKNIRSLKQNSDRMNIEKKNVLWYMIFKALWIVCIYILVVITWDLRNTRDCTVGLKNELALLEKKESYKNQQDFKDLFILTDMMFKAVKRGNYYEEYSFGKFFPMTKKLGKFTFRRQKLRWTVNGGLPGQVWLYGEKW